MATTILIGTWLVICLFLLVLTLGEWREAIKDERHVDASKSADRETRYAAGVSKRLKLYDLLTVVFWVGAGITSVDWMPFEVLDDLIGVPIFTLCLVLAAVLFALRVVASRHLRKFVVDRL